MTPVRGSDARPVLAAAARALRRLGITAGGLALVLTVAACGSASNSAAPTAAVSPTTAPAASTGPEASTSPAATPAGPSPTASASAAPTASPSAELQALMARLPTSVGSLALSPQAIDGARYLTADPTARKGLADFVSALGLKPTDVLIAVDVPGGSGPQGYFPIQAWRFVGADPAAFKKAYVAGSGGAISGTTTEEKTIGGRTVVTVTPPASGPSSPTYLYFDGDTVFVVDAANPAFAASAVEAIK